MRMLGILGTNTSPPCITRRVESTKSTPSSSVIQNRVMRSSVIGSADAPSRTSFWNSGTTEPRDPTTLP